MPQITELNLRDYSNIFLKRKWIAFIGFLVVFLSVSTYTYLLVPVYRTDVLLRFEEFQTFPSELLFPSRQFWQFYPRISDYAKQIVSIPILESAIEELGWVTDKTPIYERRKLISILNEDIQAKEVSGSNMMRVYVKSTDPQKAADLANAIFRVFKRVNFEQRNQRVINAKTFIVEKLEEVSEKLKKQEDRLRALTTMGVVGSAVQIVDKINMVEGNRLELLTKYTANHPTIKALDEQLSELKKDLSALPDEEFEYANLQRDIKIDEGLYMELKSNLQEVLIRESEKVDNVILVNPAVAPKQPYYPNKTKNYMVGMFLGILFGVTLALITEHLDTSIGRVEDIESFIKVSVLGVIPYGLRKKLEAEDIEKKWQKWQKILFKKKPKKKTISKEVTVFDLEQHYTSIFLEAFRILSVNLQVIFGEGGKIRNKIIMITSCNPEEGKTLVCTYLGMMFAQMGYKVLILDSDIRRADIHHVFGLEKKEGGFTDILMGKISPDSAVRTATDLMLGTAGASKIMNKPWLNNLNLITAGSVVPNAIHLFNSDKMSETMNYFKNKYDVVLIDTSPILAVSEPSILVPHSDGVVLVYKAGSTSRMVLNRAKTQIESIKGKGFLSGVILNNVRPEIGMDTYYYYSRGYYPYPYHKEKKYKDKEESPDTEGEGGGKDV